MWHWKHWLKSYWYKFAYDFQLLLFHNLLQRKTSQVLLMVSLFIILSLEKYVQKVGIKWSKTSVSSDVLRKTLRFSAESALYCSCLLETLFPLASNDDVDRITMGRIGVAVVVDDGKLTRRFWWKELDFLWRDSWRNLVFENHVGQKHFDEEPDILFRVFFFGWMVWSVWVVGLDCFLIPFVWYETSLKYV